MMNRCLAVLALTSVISAPLWAQRRLGFPDLEQSNDLAYLEKIASSLEEAQKIARNGMLASHGRDARTTAYARLGAIGTPESLAAVERIEAAARKLRPTPTTHRASVWTHPTWHTSDMTPELSKRVRSAQDGMTYALVRGNLYGRNELYLLSSKTPDDLQSWSRPILVPGDVPRFPVVSTLELKESKALAFTVSGRDGSGAVLAPVTMEVALEEIREDSDGDGWTDAEETMLALDPKKPDTDGDGVADGADICPDFAPPAQAATDEKVIMLQRAFFATFGLSESLVAVLVNKSEPRVQFWGYCGPVLYTWDAAKWTPEGSYPVRLTWEFREVTDSRAVVSIRDYEASLSGGSQNVTLKKINGQWYVVQRATGMVS